MGKGSRVTPRVLNSQLNNEKNGEINRENMKRVNLFFDRIFNLNKLPYTQSLWISELKSKAQAGNYFIINEEISKDDTSGGIVNWNQIAEDIEIHLDLISSEVIL